VARIRHIAISNFRCIQDLSWYPAPGINCLIGPGDNGKSSILDAFSVLRRSTRAHVHGRGFPWAERRESNHDYNYDW
jgi:putative ATP-dependent endonuclease of the OLD family